MSIAKAVKKKSTKKQEVLAQEFIEVIGANENNLKNIDVKIPRDKLVVVTGVSGSGKSSLAFDTIYAEGQRRYMETFTSYARQFIGDMERPEVEKIDGLSPVISIEQKTTGRNPRSTVGTITEVYDFMRLLFARVADAYSYETGKQMVRYTEEQMGEHIHKNFKNKKILLLAPLVRARKGHYRELFDQIRKQGYTKVRVDGKVIDLVPGMQIDRYKVHDIEVVIDRFKVEKAKIDRLYTSLSTALNMGNGFIMVSNHETGDIHAYSKHLMCPESGISYEEPSPNAFSFNSPYGYCPDCNGLGKIPQVDIDKVIPDDSKSINEVGIAPFGEVRDNTTFKQLRAIAKKNKFTFSTPIKKIPKKALETILYGGAKPSTKVKEVAHDFVYDLSADGSVKMLGKWYTGSSSEKIRKWTEEFMTIDKCETCDGQRLRKASRHFKIEGKNIADLAEMDINLLYDWFTKVDKKLNKRQKLISKDVLNEIKLRIGFLLHVGLDYLTLDRSANTLSGGEAQRIRLATQIGSQLTGITYILDEPSIGLHQRDNHKLIMALQELLHLRRVKSDGDLAEIAIGRAALFTWLQRANHTGNCFIGENRERRRQTFLLQRQAFE